MKPYYDTKVEIEILETTLERLELDYKWWQGQLNPSKHPPHIPLNECVENMRRIGKRINTYTDLLALQYKLKEDIEKLMSTYQGIEGKILYYREVKGMTLKQIAENLGYSYAYIRNINSRLNKKMTIRIQSCS
ncbi:hypothetical protein [Thermoactinomyces sp. DSM 45892]|uniref:hypothetical protein n=1 Tax=Thermoactinomyces sp. DSM 45892 TaxID=1882753 RepID=UPI000898DBC7|nr:hypothetical protein [Thermoactinomyces sp. DSM 45892]SDY85975.1 hypothetical protein SAMN05444416_10995 [Thermoactinomyces sp. DSM 45892]